METTLAKPWPLNLVSGGGTYELGMVFKVQPDGTGYTVLLNFSGSDGEGPHAGLVLADTKTDTKRVKNGIVG
jgi:hypothetical protein